MNRLIRRWQRARAYKRAIRAGQADNYRRIIDELRRGGPGDFARWETEYCDSRPLPDLDTTWWDA